MSSSSRMTASAVVGGLVLLCLPVGRARAGRRRSCVRSTHIASIAAGSIQGIVQDERARRWPAPWCRRSARRRRSRSAIAAAGSSCGRCRPGPYLVRAHLTGFVASRGQVIDVRPSARASSSIALRHVSAGGAPASFPVLAAGVGAAPDAPRAAPAADPPATPTTPARPATTITARWRGGCATRAATILKDATLPDEMVARRRRARRRHVRRPDRLRPRRRIAGAPGDELLRRHAVLRPGQPADDRLVRHAAAAVLAPTTSRTTSRISRSARRSASTPTGPCARALTQGDIASWIVAGAYTTRAPARHRYDIGLSYSTQRYDGGNVAALRDVTDGSRNAGAIYALRHVRDLAGR